VHVAQAAGLVAADGGVTCAEVATSYVGRTANLQGKHHAACGEVMFVLSDAVVFDFSLVGQAKAVFAVQVVGSAGAGFQGCGGTCREGDLLLDALVFGALGVVERVLGVGAGGGGVVGEDFALGGGELVAGRADFGVFRSFLDTNQPLAQ
jgi:hypothetical protein